VDTLGEETAGEGAKAFAGEVGTSISAMGPPTYAAAAPQRAAKASFDKQMAT